MVKLYIKLFTMKLLPLVFLALFGCNSPKPLGDNSRNSLDWQGVYTGTLPCADCPGIKTMIRLYDDSYEMQSRYLERSDSVFTTRGSFSWNDEGSVITLSSGQNVAGKWKVGENRLIMLDKDGKEIAGSTASAYSLAKVQDGIKEKYWKLVELNGKPVVYKERARDSYLVLKEEGNKVNGNGGCNSFFGTYTLDGTRLRFSGLGSTKMACPDLDIESEFFEVLSKTDSYHYRNDTLQLFRARMAPLARMVAVYMK